MIRDLGIGRERVNIRILECDAEIENEIVIHSEEDLPDFEERQIFVLHAATGLRHREIAEILDLPTGTVLSKYNSALKKMRKEIEIKRKGEA